MRKRSIQLLAVLLGAAAALMLWRWSDPGDQARGLQGGPLFDFAPDAVVRLELRRTTGTDILVRGDAGWRLEGRATDLVDDRRIDEVLATLVPGHGYPVLPGTEPGARRFGFADENALELVFHLRDGGRRRLALGDPAPVSEQVYASGAGRPGVFGVGAREYLAAMGLPDSVRLPRLLPPVALSALDSLRIARHDQPDLVFARGERGRWWLRLPGGLDALVGPAARYHRVYDDRRRTRDHATWAAASRRRLADVVFRATDTAVTRFVPADSLTSAMLADLGLAPPRRVVTMRSGDVTRRIALGERDPAGGVPARRLETVLIARPEVLQPLTGRIEEFLDLTALGFALADADSVHIDRPDRPVLWGRRAADPRGRFRAGLSPWDPLTPPGWRLGPGPERVANHLHDIQVYLDRLEMRAVVSRPSPRPLAGDDRWRVRAWFGEEEVRTVWLGERQPDGLAVLWEPAGERVVVIDSEILTSLRNLGGVLRPEQ
jgi:hypothetical protein